MTKGKARHHIFPPSWEARLQTKEDILNWIRFYDIDEALKALGTIVSLNHSSIFYKTDNLIQVTCLVIRFKFQKMLTL